MKQGSEHYKKGKIEPIHLIESQKLSFMEGNVIKYVCRHSWGVDSLGDLLKARDYLNHIIREERKLK